MISLGNEKVQERMRKCSGKASLRAIRSERKRRLQEREGRRWAETVKGGRVQKEESSGEGWGMTALTERRQEWRAWALC